MGREVKRVDLTFDWPLGKVWEGYLSPPELDLPQCPACGGRGYSPRALELFDLWYGNAPFRPEDNGSTPLTPDTLGVRAFAMRNVERSPDYYGTGEIAIYREASRLARLWNGSWSHHLNPADVAALVAAGRLYDLTHTWTKADRWQPIDPPVTPTPEQVNEWALRGLGHDSINASVAVNARCEREGVSHTCDVCGGDGDVATQEQRDANEAWEPTEPPEGDGWQLWSTTTEGNPESPVFATAEELAQWMTENPCMFAGARASSYEVALNFVRAGWAPSLISTPATGVLDGAEWIGATHGE